ncbi:hypothetical protein ONS95_010305 [Cadophora gregata]|uniref:uncharacterized protein n=1 Tax=Cadophora gregata TaxID=51156 RepID=UPI0026DA95E3|nr:uncharacterized protein ONS95_010305 [Cadophora gregata]KAK0122041.1 hypothetical protein ONS95_010305 [Cadophora gregata]KAK0127516.1 hypothetical protein ONS96_007050 [Cadophora gregata f. sp. sojae]
MPLVQLAARHPSDSGPAKAMKASSGPEDHKRRRLQKATPGCYFDTRFSPGQRITGDSSVIGVESCLEVDAHRTPADDDVWTRGCQNQDTKLQLSSSARPRIIGAHSLHHPLPLPRPHQKSQKHVLFLQPRSSSSFLSDDSISIYSTHSFISPAPNDMDAEADEVQIGMYRRRSKTPVFFVGQLERKSVECELDKAQLLASEYQAVLPLRLKTSFAQSQISIQNHEEDHDRTTSISTSYRIQTRKRLRKIKCQLSLRDLVKQHSQCGASPSPSTPGSDAETLVGSPPCSPLDADFEKEVSSDRRSLFSSSPHPHHQTQIHDISDEDDELSLPALSKSAPENDIGLKICTELLTNELTTALLRHHQPLETETEAKDRASGLQILLMIEAYETVQSQVRRMLYDARVTGKQFGHVSEAERILEHWLKALYAVYDREQEEEGKRIRRGLGLEWSVGSGEDEGRRVVKGRVK